MDPFESLVERQIREAQERGEFDNLPGAGKPLRGLDGREDPDWWVKQMMQREGLDMADALPPVMAHGITLGSQANSVFASGGTALVVHAGPDDMKTDPAGAAGDRIACGVISK